jgi:hypothetical protein
MKIYDSNMGGVPASGAQRTQETQQADHYRPGGKVALGSGADRVEFSGTLGQLSRAISSSQADRSSRIGALAAQYQSGTYKPDSAATSRAMISEALGFGTDTGLQ